ncbi:serine hydrolase [Lutibacter sp.]|uniref:serine hydrolase domain-containing protein n=1 Tax=Lutibacter sp. TaxID=1925666 RepID=UPI0025BD06AE|nr:serine hydrolase domain-containing protein [Lutibacter sp.]
MKIYFKYLASALAITLFVFILSTRSEASENGTNSSASIAPKVESIVIENYSAEETKLVSLKLDALLQSINKRNDFHGSVLVAKNGKVLYKKNVGYADFNKKEPLNDEFTFQLASVSKQFTAAAIMLLNERNQVQLNDLVSNYFPDFPYENVTIKNLLNHTAGLPKYFWVTDNKWKQEKAPTNSEMMQLLDSVNVQRFFTPGQKFDYSNTGYFVLASIVEKVSGLSFSDFMKKNVFDPLEMKDSFVYSFEIDSTRANQLDGYRLVKGWRHSRINKSLNDAIVGDKNVYSTCEDLLKWTLSLNSGKLLSEASLKLMYAKGETKNGREIPYGFGFRIDEKDEKAIYHHGNWNGFSTSLTRYPEDDLVIIILEHTSYKGLTALNNSIKKIVTENFKG